MKLLVTTFNDASFVNDFFNWLRNNHTYFEKIHIYDDCSIDQTTNLISREIQKFPYPKKISLTKSSYNSSRPSLPRNNLMKMNSNSWVMLLDMGDIPSSEYLDFIKSFSLNENHVYTGIKISYTKKIPKLNLKHRENNISQSYSKLLHYKMMYLLSGTLFYNKNDVIFENTPLEDWKFFINLSSKRKIFLLKFPIFYQQTGNDISPKKITQIKRIISYFHQFERSASKHI